MLNTVTDEPRTKRATNAKTENGWRQDEDEVARRIEKGINDAKAAFSAKLEDGKFAAERFMRQGRYAVEDSLSELTHTIKRHPMSFLGVAFAAGTTFGLLIALSTRREASRE
jgi:hypothetical protein